MGFFTTHWVGEFEGHKIEVVRRVGGHQFELLIDDQSVDVETSLVNMGKRHLEGTLLRGDTTLLVHAIGVQDAFSEGAIVKVGEQTIEMKKVS